ncbi:hypothetical protein QTO34_002245 [Cnephaeus nilssonii]|uniref:Uncharacterized protein n=1 Tax=Cnephaeus nilssonii TaxID=3371016 RepID=A0AA40HUN5_CNENI|nr:hypothetical protein QTO34_002245 [Eptesicus nilssonii]
MAPGTPGSSGMGPATGHCHLVLLNGGYATRSPAPSLPRPNRGHSRAFLLNLVPCTLGLAQVQVGTKHSLHKGMQSGGSPGTQMNGNEGDVLHKKSNKQRIDTGAYRWSKSEHDMTLRFFSKMCGKVTQIRTTYGVSIFQSSLFMAKLVKCFQAVAKYRMTMPTIISWNYTVGSEASETTAVYMVGKGEDRGRLTVQGHQQQLGKI